MYHYRAQYSPYGGAWGNPQASSWSAGNQITPSRGHSHQRKTVPLNASGTGSDIDLTLGTPNEMCSKLDSSTSVVNVRQAELRKLGYKDLEDWVKDPNHVYVGRDMTRYVPGAKGSKWGNPFMSKKVGRAESCNMYRQYILSDTRIQDNGKTLLQSLDELKGKTLGCWCHPERCHGHELSQLIKEHCKRECS